MAKNQFNRFSSLKIKDFFFPRRREHSVDGNDNVGFETSSTYLNEVHKNERKSNEHKHDHEHSKLALGKILGLRNKESGAFHLEEGKNEVNESKTEKREVSAKIADGDNSTTVSNNTFEAVAMEEENEMEVTEIVPYDIAEKQLEKGRDIEESDNEDISADEDCLEEFGDTEIYPYPDIYLTKDDCDQDDSVEIEVILSSNSPGSGARKYQGGRFIGEVARSMKGRRKKHSEAESADEGLNESSKQSAEESSDEGMNEGNEISQKRKAVGISEVNLSEQNNVSSDTEISETVAASEKIEYSSRNQGEVEIENNQGNGPDLIESLSNTLSKNRHESVKNKSENSKEFHDYDGQNSSGVRTEEDEGLGEGMSLRATNRDSSDNDSCTSEVETSTGDQIIADSIDRIKKPTSEVLGKCDKVLGTNGRDVNIGEQQRSTVEFHKENQSSEHENPGEEKIEIDENNYEDNSESDNGDDSESEQETEDDNSDGKSESECDDEAGTDEHSEESNDSVNDDELASDNSSKDDSDSGNEECDDLEVDHEDDSQGTEHLQNDTETDIKPSNVPEIRIENILPGDPSLVAARRRLATPIENDIQVTLIDDMPPILTDSVMKEEHTTITTETKDTFRVI